MFRDAQFANSWRDLEVTYIFGKTGSGKTRSVMDKYGYANCYRVTDYKHPFDTYDGQDVLIFEEFRGGLKHGDMLNYLDGYPLLLPCRYFNRQACYTKVFIITNIAPDEQYVNIDRESRSAFWRRIHVVKEFECNGRITTYPGVQAYADTDAGNSMSVAYWLKSIFNRLATINSNLNSRLHALTDNGTSYSITDWSKSIFNRLGTMSGYITSNFATTHSKLDEVVDAIEDISITLPVPSDWNLTLPDDISVSSSFDDSKVRSAMISTPFCWHNFRSIIPMSCRICP